MKRNIGTPDRILRVLAGIVAIILSFLVSGALLKIIFGVVGLSTLAIAIGGT